MHRKASTFAGLVATAALLSACASAPPPKPDDTLSQADFAIDQAAGAVSNDSQSLPLYQARQKVEKARELVNAKDNREANYRKARWLAEEAIQDARYARAQAESEQAVAQRTDLEDSLDTLREETRRVQEQQQ